MHIKKFLILIILLIPLNIYSLNKAPIDITKMDITELSKALEYHIITSEDLVNLYLDRINEYNDYNAIITINENAIDEARKLDKERSNGKVRSVLHGIPIIVKDNIDVKGMPTTGGAKALKDNMPIEDAFAIKRLKEAGAIILAKSNMSEFAFYSSSSKSSYKTVKNAYNIEYSSYGSSGGSATSVSLSLAAAALGTDTNSSVRVPAAASYLVGYRPTVGLISRTGVLPYDSERDTIGTLTKSANDSIILTKIISGYDSNDYKSNKDSNWFEIDLTQKSLNGITIGVPKNFLYGSAENILNENKEGYKEITSLMEKAIKKMKSNGAKIVYLDNYFTTKENNIVEKSYSGYLFCDKFNEYIKGTTGSIRSFQELNKSNQKVTDISSYIDSCNSTKTLDEKNKNKNNYKNYLENIYKENNLDVIVYPTTKNKLLKVGETGIINLSAHAAPTVNFPAINMPLGFDSDHLPYGIEFMALQNEDEKLFNIVSVYEKLNVEKNPKNRAQSLYKIDNNVTKLINNYKKTNNSSNNFIMKSWLKKVKDYLNDYNNIKKPGIEAKKLNNNYFWLKILNFLYKIVKIVLLIIISLVIILLVRKIVIRKIRKLRRKLKRSKKLR